MARNVEIKAALQSGQLEQVRARALQRATSPPRRLHQRDVFYHARIGRLKLRYLDDGSAVLVSYQRGEQLGPKLSSYQLYPCAEPAQLHRALSESLGVRGVVEKQRDVIMIEQTRVHLDEVEGLGAFIELEVVLAPDESVELGERIAAELIGYLGIAEHALIEGAYMDLLEAR